VSKTFFQGLSGNQIFIAETPEEVLQIISENRFV
jgi:hypothetical protein